MDAVGRERRRCLRLVALVRRRHRDHERGRRVERGGRRLVAVVALGAVLHVADGALHAAPVADPRVGVVVVLGTKALKVVL